MSLLKDIEPIKTRDYLKTKFQEYYQSAEITLPPRFTSREWGFLNWNGGIMNRHINFRANFVVPPPIAIKIAQHIVDLGIKHLWFQPGSESTELENWLKNTDGIKYLINACIMVETR